ncbi:ADP-ribosylglycohydrolase family protein [Amycolatopsis rhizosphaerae]|uniref:ADP-ribosylglycohydrolase family protein n=1 Tax=Amycolatopsis rhizosphaerae TaxID=2053003 RepID=UPI001C954AF0|nr:ADP-ribosylglycohydrolase family protein [Amycolatopsis rhizosphaerae]
MSRLNARQADRAAGALLGAAVADALGVPYEYGSRPLEEQPRMHGGGLGGYAPGQWSDDTEMTVCLARVAATGLDLRTEDALNAIATASGGGMPTTRPISARRPVVFSARRRAAAVPPPT